jgi:hypothetical protein
VAGAYQGQGWPARAVRARDRRRADDPRGRGIRAPEVVDGIRQKPIEGASFAYTFDAKTAKAPSRHRNQYFEMMGQTPRPNITAGRTEFAYTRPMTECRRATRRCC